MTKPTTINVHRKSATLELIYPAGERYELTAELLRVLSPSAEVRGHAPGQQVLQTGKRNVQFKDIEPQGNYAIRIIFSDGHDSGIYTWDYLHHLGKNQATLWQSYLARLEAAGQSRDPHLIASS